MKSAQRKFMIQQQIRRVSVALSSSKQIRMIYSIMLYRIPVLMIISARVMAVASATNMVLWSGTFGPLAASRPLPSASAHWLVQCTLECHWLTQCTLGYRWATQRILAGYTGTPLEKLSWIRPTLGCHWRNSNFCSLRWNTTGGTVAAHTRHDTNN